MSRVLDTQRVGQVHVGATGTVRIAGFRTLDIVL